jgi:hypothetical protein
LRIDSDCLSERSPVQIPFLQQSVDTLDNLHPVRRINHIKNLTIIFVKKTTNVDDFS